MADENSELIEYALGILDAESSQRLSRQLDTDKQLQTELEEIHCALNSLAQNDNHPIPAPQPQLKDHILNAVQPASPYAGFVERLCRLFELGTSQIQTILADISRIGSAPWEITEIPGVQLLHFDGGPSVASADSGLVYVEPGKTFPQHKHGGDEWSLVIQGEVEDSGTQRYYPGDLIHFAPGTDHYFTSAGKQALILAVVLFDGYEVLG